jgi:hypothetical protein
MARSAQKSKASSQGKPALGKLKSVPVATTRQITIQKPRISSTPDGVILFKHTEYIADLNGSVDFDSRTLALNPGNEDVFPYLSNIAVSFEYYKFRKLRLRYEPSCSTSTPGAVMLCIDYDASDSAPLGKTSFMMNQNATRCSSWSRSSMDLVAKANGAQVKRFVLNDFPPPNTDVKMYNLGNLFIATQGSTAAPIGEIYVDYEVELSVPQGATTHDVTAELVVNADSDPVQPYAHVTVNQNNRAPILDVPGVTSPSVSYNQDILRVVRAGRYILNSTLISTMATGAGANVNTPGGWTGSGVTITNMPTSTIGSLTAGVSTLGQWLLEFDPELVTDASKAGWFVFGSMAAVATPALAAASRIFLSRQPLLLQDHSSAI